MKEFEFLYYLNGHEERHQRTRVVKAHNVRNACRKFMRTKPESLTRIDYEVRHGDEFIDISGQPGVCEFM